MPTLLELLALWLPLGLVLVSFAEYAAHRWLMHRWLLYAFWFRHSILHHGRYYRTFDDEPHPVGREVNLRIAWGDTLLACALAAPLGFVSLDGLAVLYALAILHRWTWNAIHAEMHLCEGRWFTRCPGVRHVYDWLRWKHFLHHQQPNRNFNVTLPLFDFLFCTDARPRAEDYVAWAKLQSNQHH